MPQFRARPPVRSPQDHHSIAVPQERETLLREYGRTADRTCHVFHTPFHLPHLQILDTIARAALFHDATVTPLDRPVCDVLAVAKRDLKAGEVLGPVGGFDYYGILDEANTTQQEQLLPVGLAEGHRLSREIRKDRPIAYRDVVAPRRDRLCDILRAEQDRRFFAPTYTHRAAAAMLPSSPIARD